MNDNRYAPPNARVADLSTSPAVAAAPATLQLATRLLWASLAIGLVNSALDWTYLSSAAPMNIVIGILTFTFVVIGLLIYNVGRGRNWARIVLLVFAIIGLPSLTQLPANFARSPLSGSLSLLQTVIQFTALYIMFVTSARHAFSKRKSAQQTVQPDRA